MHPLRVVIVPRWAGGPTSDFYPWLIAKLGPELAVECLALPEPQAPTIATWVPAIRDVLGDSAARSRTLVIGHSVGCMAVMRALDDELAPVGALLAVAGWWTVDRPWPTIVPWIEAPLDTTRVRRNAPRVHVLVSDDDPFTADATATVARFERELGATSTLIPAGRHFNLAEEPAVLDAARRLLGELR